MSTGNGSLEVSSGGSVVWTTLAWVGIVWYALLWGIVLLGLHSVYASSLQIILYPLIVWLDGTDTLVDPVPRSPRHHLPTILRAYRVSLSSDHSKALIRTCMRTSSPHSNKNTHLKDSRFSSVLQMPMTKHSAWSTSYSRDIPTSMPKPLSVRASIF
jgi:hypothetical protein